TKESDMNTQVIDPVRHGLMMAVLALLLGASWAGYMATHHETLHGAFEAQEQQAQQAHGHDSLENMSMDAMVMNTPANHGHDAGTPADHHGGHDAGKDATGHAAGGQHSHSGSLAKDAMQRLLRGHIHFMGIGVLASVLLLIVAFTSLKPCWKRVLGWTLGLGALAYPPAWILMGFRTVELGPEAAEASVLWLFGPAVGLLMASMGAVLIVLFLESCGLQYKVPVVKGFFEKKHEEV
ncbi:MAG: hypothetical protein R8K22_09190, partial [Mariprofundaceae bacterium]